MYTTALAWAPFGVSQNNHFFTAYCKWTDRIFAEIIRKTAAAILVNAFLPRYNQKLSFVRLAAVWIFIVPTIADNPREAREEIHSIVSGPGLQTYRGYHPSSRNSHTLSERGSAFGCGEVAFIMHRESRSEVSCGSIHVTWEEKSFEFRIGCHGNSVVISLRHTVSVFFP